MNKKHLSKVEANRVRREALAAMGFCPSCNRFNDRFPLSECSRCTDLKRMRFKNGKQALPRPT